MVAAGTAGGAANTLVFRRSDHSPIAFKAPIRVWCGPWQSDVPTRAIQVLVMRTSRKQSYWFMTAVAGDVRPGKVLRFHVGFTYKHPHKAQLFVYDAKTHNELNSEAEESKGTIVFSKASCTLGKPVVFTAKGTIASEFSDGKPISVNGSFRGTVGKRPAGL